MSTTMIQPPSKLQVFYDGACPLCSREMRGYQARDREHHVDFVDIANPNFDAAAFGLDPVRVQQVMHVRTPEGKIYTQVHAFRKLWKALPPTFITMFLRGLLAIPGMTPLANVFYRLFARNRYRLTGRCTPTSCP